MKILKKIFSIETYSNVKYINILCFKFKIKNIKSFFQQIDYKLYKYLSEEKYPIALKDWFYEKTGEILNLENPKSFNEKIQWLKLYDRDPKKSQLADKYVVRDWIKEQIGEKYLIDLLGVWNNANDIDFSQLPNQFVLKCNHGCGYNIIVTDKRKIDIKKIRQKLNEWLLEDYSFKFGFQLHYSLISPKVIAEKYLFSKNGLSDYKLWCFNGKVHWIQYITDRDKYYKMAFYDENWIRQDFVTNHKIIETEVRKPKNLDELIRLAEVLSKNFVFVRVDFYVLDDGTIKFGEMTFTPGSGVLNWNPKKQNYEIGKLIKISKDV